jgi:hypothetical protein
MHFKPNTMHFHSLESVPSEKSGEKVEWLARPAIMAYHKLGSFKDRGLLSHHLGVSKSEIKEQTMVCSF